MRTERSAPLHDPFVAWSPAAQAASPGTLRTRFLAAWGDEGAGRAAFRDLERRYGAARRAHHDLGHVEECLCWVDAYHASLAAPRVDLDVELALFFHDAVLVPGRSDNELRSARLFEHWARRGRLSEERIGTVREHILATASGEHNLSNGARLVRGADLAILGAPTRRYREYAEAIRREHSSIPSSLYRWGRARFLRRMLEQTDIYGLPFFREALDEQARNNLADELLQLEGG